jgi:hypothetical protein
VDTISEREVGSREAQPASSGSNDASSSASTSEPRLRDGPGSCNAVRLEQRGAGATAH